MDSRLKCLLIVFLSQVVPEDDLFHALLAVPHRLPPVTVSTAAT